MLIDDVKEIDNLDAILAIEGLDTILVGPADLSGLMSFGRLEPSGSSASNGANSDCYDQGRDDSIGSGS